MANNPLEQITKGLNNSKDEQLPNKINLTKAGETVKRVNGQQRFYTPKYIQFFNNTDENQ